MQAWGQGLQLYLKRGSGTGAFRWILQIFLEHLFHLSHMYCTINWHLGVDLLELLHNGKYLVRVTSTRRESHVKVQLKHMVSPKRKYKSHCMIFAQKHLPITMKGNLAKLNWNILLLVLLIFTFVLFISNLLVAH